MGTGEREIKCMDKKYIGIDEKGNREPFSSDNLEDARPENSGYERVEDEDGNEVK